eukprot:jgi/Tetstr1/440905/TSEL_029176.t1
MASENITFPLDPEAEEDVPMDQEETEGDVEEDSVAADGGLVTAHMRNKMGVEMMSDQCCITKNVDAATEISSILKENMGPDTFKVAFPAQRMAS